MGTSHKRLGELLVRENLISLQQLRQAQDEQKRSGVALGAALAKLGFTSETEITQFLSQQYRVPAVNLEDFEIDPDVIKLIPKEVCEKHKIIPISRAGSQVVVAMADPTNLHAIDDIKFLTGFAVEPVVAGEGAIGQAIERYYTPTGPSYDEVMAGFDENEIQVSDLEEEVNVNELERQSEDAPVVRLVNMILLNAIKKGASDIHIEPYEKKFRVRYRVDGVLQEEMAPPLKLKNAIASRVKIMSSLDISERRLPQDGRIRAVVHGRKVDLRLSTLPTVNGEKVVMRILDNRSINVKLEDLGFSDNAFTIWTAQIDQPHGILLVTGPTGSGKTTTLYSSLRCMDGNKLNIATVEDPIEYHLAQANQVQVHDKIGMTFAAALRALLRQDPDVIMLGEIRDAETANIAVQASLTGHLVLSTLHTNDAPASITRLINIGVEPYLISSAVNAILAQRLVRKICPHCKEEHTPTDEMREFLSLQGFPDQPTYHGKGCDKCRKTGYSGRLGIYELLVMDDSLRDLVTANPDVTNLRKVCRERGLVTLREDGIQKVMKGLTTVDEVLRVTENAV